MEQQTQINSKTKSQNTAKSLPLFDSEGKLEKIGTGIDILRLWSIKAWKIGMLMAKGAYLLSERRRLFSQLGEEVYYKF